MDAIDLNNLTALLVIARERSFTRAAAQLGVSQSALSHTVRRLEERLGVRLLARTTRGVSPTEAGQRLLSGVGPLFDGIQSELTALTDLQQRPSGTVRISAHDHAASTILWPKLSPLLPHHPDLQLEISINYGLIDIVKERFDAGVRLGSQVAKDMIAIRIGPDFRMVVVGSPSYFKGRLMPTRPADLTLHDCINLRLPTYGGLYPWEFAKRGKRVEVQVRGQWIFNTTPQIHSAASAGVGLAFVPEDLVEAELASGQLIQVLGDWSPLWPGYHLYFPNRHQPTPAFRLVSETLRYRADRKAG